MTEIFFSIGIVKIKHVVNSNAIFILFITYSFIQYKVQYQAINYISFARLHNECIIKGVILKGLNAKIYT